MPCRLQHSLLLHVCRGSVIEGGAVGSTQEGPAVAATNAGVQWVVWRAEGDALSCDGVRRLPRGCWLLQASNVSSCVRGDRWRELLRCLGAPALTFVNP